MNLRLERYLSGAAFHARTIYIPGGRRVAVLDKTRRWRSAARRMRAAGHADSFIAGTFRLPRASLDRVLDFRWRF